MTGPNLNSLAAAIAVSAMAMAGTLQADAATDGTTNANPKASRIEGCFPAKDKDCMAHEPAPLSGGTPSASRTRAGNAGNAGNARGAQRTGDPLPDVDVSLDRKTGGASRQARPCDRERDKDCKDQGRSQSAFRLE